KASSGTHELHGGIRDRYISLGREMSALGYPITDETGTPDGYGRFNTFEGGAIYWTPSTGAKYVLGAIRDYWANAGWETSGYGYPTTDEVAEHDPTWGDWRHSDFQHGSIYWNAVLAGQGKPATFGLYTDIASKFWDVRQNGTLRWLGFPIGSEAPTPRRS